MPAFLSMLCITSNVIKSDTSQLIKDSLGGDHKDQRKTLPFPFSKDATTVKSASLCLLSWLDYAYVYKSHEPTQSPPQKNLFLFNLNFTLQVYFSGPLQHHGFYLVPCLASIPEYSLMMVIPPAPVQKNGHMDYIILGQSVKTTTDG